MFSAREESVDKRSSQNKIFPYMYKVTHIQENGRSQAKKADMIIMPP